MLYRHVLIANFQFGRPCAGEGPDLDWFCRTRCWSCRIQAGHPGPGARAAAFEAGSPCPGARAAAPKAGGVQSRRESTRTGSTYCRVESSKCGSVSTKPEPGPEVCAGREAYPSH
jgi:hypothetical protein